MGNSGYAGSTIGNHGAAACPACRPACRSAQCWSATACKCGWWGTLVLHRQLCRQQLHASRRPQRTMTVLCSICASHTRKQLALVVQRGVRNEHSLQPAGTASIACAPVADAMETLLSDAIFSTAAS